MDLGLKLENIKYLKISCKDVDNKLQNLKVAIRSINNRGIIACMKFVDNLNIKFPQDVSLSIVCNEGLYKTKSELTNFEIDFPYIIFELSALKGIEYFQNREYFRICKELDCVYSIVKNEKIIDYSCKTRDISANGVTIVLPEYCLSDSFTIIKFNINNLYITTKARYIRYEKVGDNYLLSFTFDEIIESDRDIISQFCLKYQLEQKKNTLM